MVSKIGGAGRTQNIMMPTQDELKKVYGSLVDEAFKNGTAKALKHAPKGIEKYSSVDITPKGEMGVGKQVYMFKGELYLKQQVVAPNAQPHWFKIGPAPMF